MILTDADQLREALRVALKERDEARAEVKRTYREMQDLMEAHKADAARLTEERDRVARELRLLDEHGNLRAALSTVAERQREAYAARVMEFLGVGDNSAEVRAVHATPLVTEGEP